MAQITIQGQKVNVSDNFFQLSPEDQDATVDEIAAEMAQPPQAGDASVFKSGPATQAPPATPATLSGVAKQFGVDAIKGTIGVAATPANARVAASGVARWAAENLGASPEMAQTLADAVNAGFVVIPGAMGMPSDQIIGKINDVTRPAPSMTQLVTGEQPEAPLERKPQNIEEAYAGAAGEFLPGVLGPGGPIRKGAQWLLPAVASETAGQVTKGTEYEPLARAGLGLAGGLAAAGGKGNLVKEIAKGSPTRETVQQATSAAYDRLRQAGITYNPMAFENMAIDIMGELKKGGFRRAQAPLTADAITAVGEQLQRGAPDYNDLESIRKTTSAILREKNATDADKQAAGIVLDALDNFMSNGKFATSGSITPAQAGPMMKEARELARRNILAKQIEEMFVKAETYQSGYESGLRNQFSNYLRSNKAKGLTKEERQAFLDVAKGNFTNNLLGSFGRLGVDFSQLGPRAISLPGGAVGAGALAGEPITGAAVVAAATGAKYAARQMTNSAAKRSMETVLAGRGAQKAAGGSLRAKQIDVMLRRMLALDTATRDVRTGLTTQPVPQQNGRDR